MWRPALLSVCVLALAGCGDEPPSPPPPAVELTIVAPEDPATVDAASVDLRGRVVPARSEVYVRGSRVEVVAGSFTASVPLEEGANVVDVAASATGRRPASTAVRVVREVPVEIPAVEGEPADESIAALERLGLRVERSEGGGILDDLLPGDPEICRLDPPAGARVKRGSTVSVITARSC